MSEPHAEEAVAAGQTGALETNGIEREAELVPAADGALPPLASLTCKLCGSYFTDPMTLPCMHTFCKGCLEKYNGGKRLAEPEQPAAPAQEEGEEEPAEDGEAGPENGAGDDFGGATDRAANAPPPPDPVCCPTCKDELQLDYGSYAFFSEPFPNDRLARIIRLLHESKILCQNCEAHASEFRCTVCDAYTCKACWEKTHGAPIFSRHQPERLTHSEMTAPPKCDSHPLTDLEYFCTDDEVGVCQVCLLKGEFRGKEYSLVSEVRKTRQSEIEAGVSEALVERARLLEARKENELTLAELETNLRERQAEVQANFAAIREALKARETETLDALNALYEAKKEVLDGQIQAIDVQKARIEDGVSNINTVLHHSNDLEVVYLTYVLQGHLGAINSVPSTSPLHDASASNHDPAVDAGLPVILSDKVTELVGAYASVPDASLVREVATGRVSQDAIAGASETGTAEQRALLKQVAGSDAEAAEYGCIIS